MDVNEYIVAECDRQHVTNYEDFRKAMNYAGNSSIGLDIDDTLGFMAFVCSIASKVEPTKNTYHVGTNRMNLRRSHVGFMNGGSASPTNEVFERFERWAEFAFANKQASMVDALIQHLLDIHPWVDGNGRTASILRNWMLGTLHDPTPLPYYYP